MRMIHPTTDAVNSHGWNLSRVQLVVTSIFLLTNIYRIFLSGGSNININIESLLGSVVEYDEEKCALAVETVVNNTAALFSETSSLRPDQKDNVIHHIVKVALDHNLQGDYVDVDRSYTPSCAGKGMASLIAAYVQRTVISEPYCIGSNSRSIKRSVWFALNEDKCIDDVKTLFEHHKFSVADANGILSGNVDVDVPIHLSSGAFNEILPDSQAGSIALLMYNSEGGEGIRFYEDVLHVLFSLYRRVPINGRVVVNNCYEFCYKGYHEFFMDGNHTLLSASHSYNSLLKKDNQIRISPHYRSSVITPSIDPKVLNAWGTLDTWHKETVRQYFGHVGTNPFQTFRYIEVMRHLVNQQKRISGHGNQSTINVCETGFNGGHSAMLFLSFLEKDKGIDVNYFGWDLKEERVASAEPTAAKMKERFGDNFHIVWGDSKVTLKQAKDVIGDQLCHVIVVDGEHSKEGVVNDLENFLKIAAPGAVVFGDDCAPYKKTVKQSEEMLNGWMEYVNRKQIISVANYRNPDLPSPGFVEGLVPEEGGNYTLGI